MGERSAAIPTGTSVVESRSLSSELGDSEVKHEAQVEPEANRRNCISVEVRIYERGKVTFPRAAEDCE